MKVFNNVIGGVSNTKYYDVSLLTKAELFQLAGYSSSVKVSQEGYSFVQSYLYIKTLEEAGNIQYSISAISIDLNIEIFIPALSRLGTVSEFFSITSNISGGTILELLNSQPQLTKEEFYDITLPTE